MTRILVSHESRFVWIAVAKVASMVIHRAITDKLGIEFDDWPRCSAASTAEVAGMDGYFRFAFVRDPWARLFSCYQDKILGPVLHGRDFIFGDFGFTPGMAFPDFVHGVAEIPDEQADGHFVGQFHTLGYQRRLVVDYVGRFENLPADWEPIRLRFGLAPLPWTPIDSARRRSDFEFHKPHYTPDLVEVVARRYADDLRHFGYRFGSVPQLGPRDEPGPSS
ncbi:MAG: sulfotransferase family 2 domain-containing protein [Pirellulaceae bacterium]|nr:sulfotransferase family 2 domain-containing protein [Pirellulaceae bacterium]